MGDWSLYTWAQLSCAACKWQGIAFIKSICKDVKRLLQQKFQQVFKNEISFTLDTGHAHFFVLGRLIAVGNGTHTFPPTFWSWPVSVTTNSSWHACPLQMLGSSHPYRQSLLYQDLFWTRMCVFLHARNLPMACSTLAHRNASDALWSCLHVREAVRIICQAFSV